MALSISDLTPEGRRYFEQLQKLSRLEVQVGFQEGQTYEDGTSLADTSDSPARPFMRQSFENHEPELKAACEQVNKTLAEGGTTEKALKDLGVFCKGLVQQEIVDGGFVANKPSTIKKKKSEQPLIDTGHMRQSVDFVIKERGD